MSTPPRAPGLPRNTWIALGVVVVYVLLAAGLGNALDGLAPEDDVAAQFALGHLVPLPIAIALVLLFLRVARWGRGVWRETPTPALTPRRWWLVSIPALAVLVPISQLDTVPWGARSVWFLALIALGTLLVGFGEELVVRGVLLTAVRERHGELVTMLVTAVVFGLAHAPGSLIAGVPPAFILFQVGALAGTGVAYYWVRRVTGRIWVGMLVHAFTDWVLYVASDAGTPTAALTVDTGDLGGSACTAVVSGLLLLATLVSVVSVVREDRRTRRDSEYGRPAP